MNISVNFVYSSIVAEYIGYTIFFHRQDEEHGSRSQPHGQYTHISQGYYNMCNIYYESVSFQASRVTTGK